jgi:hypothetical protein
MENDESSGSRPERHQRAFKLEDNTKPNLKQTTKLSVSPATRHKCYFCSKTASFQSVLFRHMIKHTKEQHNKCKYCCRLHGRRVDKISQESCMEYSMKLGNNDCYFCHRSFREYSVWREHVRKVHLREGFKRCNICRKYFSDKTQLRTHIRTVHHKERKFKCQICTKVYSTRGVLNQHIVAIHTTEGRLRCYFCKQEHFKSFVSLMHHMIRHTGEKPFLCYFCDQHFPREAARDIHLISKHTMERPFPCYECPACHFTTQGKLNEHKRKIHDTGR